MTYCQMTYCQMTYCQTTCCQTTCCQTTCCQTICCQMTCHRSWTWFQICRQNWIYFRCFQTCFRNQTYRYQNQSFHLSRTYFPIPTYHRSQSCFRFRNFHHCCRCHYCFRCHRNRLGIAVCCRRRNRWPLRFHRSMWRVERSRQFPQTHPSPVTASVGRTCRRGCRATRRPPT